MLVEGGAVEPRQPVGVLGKMTGHPVEDDADPGTMECVDQRPELFRRAETAGRRIKAGRLVAPGAVERMLGHRQKLDMGRSEEHTSELQSLMRTSYAVLC